MKCIKSYIIGFLCGAFIFGGTAVLANSDVLAKITSQIFFWNNEAIELEAYNINGYNYVRLRDAAKIFGVNVEYYEDTNSVYLGEDKKEEVKEPENKVLDGTAYAKEDYSANANKEIFNEVYTKDAYNAIRQSLVDINEIIKDTDENGYNANYEYAHYIDKDFSFNSPGKTEEAMKSAVATFSGYYSFSFGAEPTVTNLYEYPGYRICMPQVHKHFESANKATDNFIEEIAGLMDKEKLKRIADYICDRIIYKNENIGSINQVFTDNPPVNGICGTYADTLVYLCQRADIPCIRITDKAHAWNEVYIDGEWHITDIGYYDVARTDEMLLPANYPRANPDTAKTKFAKELLVPMSTK